MRLSRKITSFCILVIMISSLLLTGCLFSVRYHFQMLGGKTEAKLFPLTRYWCEVLSTDAGEILTVPLVGIPGIMPIGFLGDFIIDVLFFPIDLGMCYWTHPVKKHIISCEDETLLNIHVVRSQLHFNYNNVKDSEPITINVRTGLLNVDFEDAHTRSISKTKWQITSNEIIEINGDTIKNSILLLRETANMFYIAPHIFRHFRTLDI